MEINTNEKGEMIAKKVYNSLILETNNDKFAICMRDDGFEFKYNDVWYEAKNGKINELKNTFNDKYLLTSTNICYDPNNE